jgi:1-acylglycerone phosphate reductase
MSSPKRTVLITGCSDGGLGAALAIAFHNAGLHVYATARNPSRMKGLVALGIETLTLDVLSDASIAACVDRLSDTGLDILLNNAGGGYSCPVSDLSIAEAKRLFDLNVWSYISVTQAFLPLLIRSKGMVVNQTSLVSVLPIPFQSAYNASKAAMAMFSDNQRLELALVKSHFFDNIDPAAGHRLPKGSIYEPVRDEIEKKMRAEGVMEGGAETQAWAERVVHDVLRKSPPSVVWRGAQATTGWLASFLPYSIVDGMLRSMVQMDVVEQKIRASRRATG